MQKQKEIITSKKRGEERSKINYHSTNTILRLLEKYKPAKDLKILDRKRSQQKGAV